MQPTDDAINNVLSGISGCYQIVWAYTGQSWKVYDPADREGSTLNTMDAGQGYWVKMNAAKALSFSGSAPSSSLSLLQGWNLVGYAGARCNDTLSALFPISSNISLCWGYQTQAWEMYDPNDAQRSTLTQFCPGQGYWLKVNQAGTWSGW